MWCVWTSCEYTRSYGPALQAVTRAHQTDRESAYVGTYEADHEVTQTMTCQALAWHSERTTAVLRTQGFPHSSRSRGTRSGTKVQQSGSSSSSLRDECRMMMTMVVTIARRVSNDNDNVCDHCKSCTSAGCGHSARNTNGALVSAEGCWQLAWKTTQ
jgi:hypothetical protein